MGQVAANCSLKVGGQRRSGAVGDEGPTIQGGPTSLSGEDPGSLKIGRTLPLAK